MRPSRLIVNADDGNLTAGVLRGVLRAHDRGIVTSTTLFANFPLTDQLCHSLGERPKLGVGIHLNITLGGPASDKTSVRPLLASAGRFGKHDSGFFRVIDQKALREEFRAQIEKFSRWRESLPTHLDTHHHIHQYPPVFDVLTDLAEEYGVPVRLCDLVDLSVRDRFEHKGIMLADHLLADIGNSPYFTKPRLNEVLASLPEGVVEMMVHPAEIDEELRKMSSLVEARAQELEALTQAGLRDQLAAAGVELIHYGALKGQQGRVYPSEADPPTKCFLAENPPVQLGSSLPQQSFLGTCRLRPVASPSRAIL